MSFFLLKFSITLWKWSKNSTMKDLYQMTRFISYGKSWWILRSKRRSQSNHLEEPRNYVSTFSRNQMKTTYFAHLQVETIGKCDYDYTLFGFLFSFLLRFFISRTFIKLLGIINSFWKSSILMGFAPKIERDIWVWWTRFCPRLIRYDRRKLKQITGHLNRIKYATIKRT